MLMCVRMQEEYGLVVDENECRSNSCSCLKPQRSLPEEQSGSRAPCTSILLKEHTQLLAASLTPQEWYMSSCRGLQNVSVHIVG